MSEEEQRGEREPGATPEQSEATPEPERAPDSRVEAESETGPAPRPGRESGSASESESAVSGPKAEPEPETEPKAEPETEDERRARWLLAREADDRRRRRTRIAAWCGVGVLVLGGAGWIAEPFVQDRMITSDACDGALPDGTMATLRAGAGDAEAHLAESEAETDTGLGRYTCEVANDAGGRVLEVRVYSRRDDVDRNLVRDFQSNGAHPASALPGGLPGFEARFGGVALVPECPGLGKDAAGLPRRLFVDVLGGHGAEPHQLVRAGAAVANKAAEKLGCDRDPLTVPAKDIEESEPEGVPSARAAGTTCAALARGPFSGAGWTVDLRIPEGPAPLTSCKVRPSGEDEDGDPYPPVARLYGLYGPEVKRVMSAEAGHSGVRTDKTRMRPWLNDVTAWATARCDGRPAGFKLRVSREDEGSDKPDEQVLSRRRLGRETMRAMLVSFAEKESAARGCTGLRLPSAD
ncbi:hypothetical protein [Streptomyces sp. AA1529]|uniref:hypothetical protein n=1 Tax=Streptomyces sp. AA1529 TaxID=1203257 RepID=UPI000474E6C5|nr:hypothetical protein [Streptomyces sp. AA1529]